MAFQGSILLIRQGFVAGVKGLQEAVDLRVGGQVADADAPAGQRVAAIPADGEHGLGRQTVRRAGRFDRHADGLFAQRLLKPRALDAGHADIDDMRHSMRGAVDAHKAVLLQARQQAVMQPLHMGVAGAAWATILSQFLSAVFSTVVGLRNFPILHLRREDFHDLKGAAVLHLKTGFPMGFQMSVMCIGQLAMQAVVNSLGTAAVAGYTAASKADQLSVLVNNAMMTAISNYVAQNFGAGKKDRIRLGVRASLIQTEAFNILMCIGILLLRHPIVELFLSNPTAEIYHYSDVFLTIEAPFYFLLGLLAVYRTSIQSMQNGRAPFAACMIELVMRLAATVWLSRFLGYTAVCIASPLAWFGAVALLIPVYYRMMMKPVKTV